jgi:hypothetical protein
LEAIIGLKMIQEVAQAGHTPISLTRQATRCFCAAELILRWFVEPSKNKSEGLIVIDWSQQGSVASPQQGNYRWGKVEVRPTDPLSRWLRVKEIVDARLFADCLMEEA